MRTLEFVDELEDCFFAGNLLGGVHLKKDASWQLDEVGLEPLVNKETIDFFFLLRAEEIPTLVNLSVAY